MVGHRFPYCTVLSSQKKWMLGLFGLVLSLLKSECWCWASEGTGHRTGCPMLVAEYSLVINSKFNVKRLSISGLGYAPIREPSVKASLPNVTRKKEAALRRA